MIKLFFESLRDYNFEYEYIREFFVWVFTKELPIYSNIFDGMELVGSKLFLVMLF